MNTTGFNRYWAALVTCLAMLGATGAAAQCNAIAGLDLGHTEVALAETVAAGALDLPLSGRRAESIRAALGSLPAICRVTATARPSDDSEIQLEVWMPLAGWNGKLQGVGNGGWAGSIGYSALAGAVADGYAAVSTDSGHTGGDASFAIGHPEKLVDFAHRAVHEMTVAAKAIVEAQYGDPANRSYFIGCSTGGRQALAEAQRYPNDYDGIISGAPAYHPTHLQGMQVWTTAISQRADGAALSPAKLGLLNDAALAACDSLDGVDDGVIENPQVCPFDPATLVCASSEGDSCLSPLEAETAQMLYDGPRSASGEILFPGLERGSELGWTGLAGPEPMALAHDTYRYLVLNDPDWDFRSFDPDTDIRRAQATIAPVMNSNDPDLSPFFDRGGKLILYHGWNDPGIPPRATVNYFQAVEATVSSKQADEGIRLFMVPGMNHCGGGVGTDRFDAVSALDNWFTTGAAPSRIEARKEENGTSVRTRPLCPFPQVAVYDGSGSTDAGENFVCR